MIRDLTNDFGIPGAATNITYGNGDCNGDNISEPFIDETTGEVDFTGVTNGVPYWYYVTFDLPGDNIECSPNNCIDVQVTPLLCDCENCDPVVLNTPPLFYDCLEDVPQSDDLEALNITATGGCGILFITPISGGGSGEPPCGPFILTRTYEACDECGNCVEETQTITVTPTSECDDPCI